MANDPSCNAPRYLAHAVAFARQSRTLAMLALLLLVTATSQAVGLSLLAGRRCIACFVPEIAAPTVASGRTP